jgi:hypothetical protein
MASDISRDFTATGGVTDERGSFQIKRLDQSRKIVSVAVHVVSSSGLARPAVATAIMGDHPEAVLSQKQHLAIPRVSVQRPSV